MTRKIPVFLSVGEPHRQAQADYLARIVEYLDRRHISPETLGRTFWSIENPLKPVREKMQNVYGVVVLAMERFHSIHGIYKEGCSQKIRFADRYFPTVWTHIEAAMAYQLRLPLLILKEERLASEGIFDPGIHEWLIVRINTKNPGQVTQKPISSYIDSWIAAVKACFHSRT